MGRSRGGFSAARSTEFDEDEDDSSLQIDEEADQELDTAEAPARKEYQIYTDPEYVPQRVLGPIAIEYVQGQPRLVATEEVASGELLALSPAVVFLEGAWGEAPDSEDLQASLIEDGLSPAQGMVLHLMDQTHTQLRAGSDIADSGSAAGWEDVAASEAVIDVPSSVLSTLDVKFWSSGRKRGALSVPKMSASRLLGLIQQCGCSDSQQDAGALQARRQPPSSFLGVWPETSMLAHSCVPNTSMVVIKDRLLLHASADLASGAPLTRNTIGTQITAPLAERWAAIADVEGDDGDEDGDEESFGSGSSSTADAISLILAGGGSSEGAEAPLDAVAASAELSIRNGSSSGTAASVGDAASTGAAGVKHKRVRCSCRRCVVEGRASEAVTEALAVCRQWYLGEATELWTAVTEAPEEEEEDSPTSGMSQLRELYSEGIQLTTEVEEALSAEEGLSDEDRMMLRASVYDTYDLLVTCDEMLNGAEADPSLLVVCLELIRTFAPGSDNHTLVAIKYAQLTQVRVCPGETRGGGAQDRQDRQGLGARPDRAAERRRVQGGRCACRQEASDRAAMLLTRQQEELDKRAASSRRSGAKLRKRVSKESIAALRELQDTAQTASTYFLESLILRYGYIDTGIVARLKEGLELYLEGIESMAKGSEENTRSMEINGVQVSVVDSVAGKARGSPAADDGSEVRVKQVASRDGIQYVMVDPSK
ncbi:MAG: hypothetical protein WDW36_007161 [Sanguina aurantia]